MTAAARDGQHGPCLSLPTGAFGALPPALPRGEPTLACELKGLPAAREAPVRHTS